MKILVLSHVEPHATDEKMRPYLVPEAARAWDAYLEGFIREANFRTSSTSPGAVLVVEAESAEAAHARLDTFPMRRAGLIRFEVIGLGPFLPWTLLVDAGVDRGVAGTPGTGTEA